MAYLRSAVPRLDASIEQAVLNLAATWGAATLAHVVPLLLPSSSSWTLSLDATDPQLQQQPLLERVVRVYGAATLHRFAPIVQNTLGFGLGIAWNVFLGHLLGPSSANNNSNNDWDGIRLVGLAGYLAVVALIAFRLAAARRVPEPHATTTIGDRQWVLLEFAAYVVTAFTLVTFLNAAIVVDGWLGAVEALGILLGLSAGMSALVARADLEQQWQDGEGGGDDNENVVAGTAATALAGNKTSRTAHDDNDEHDNKCQSLQEGPFGFLFGVLLFVPCVWCCCPWVPVLWLLANTTDNDTLQVKEHWFKLIAMVAGLASSIEASSMLTDATNVLATPFCTAKHCRHPWLFVLLQSVMAFVVTLVLIPAISNLSEPAPPTPAALGTETATETSSEPVDDDDDGDEQGERKPLLRRFRDKFRKPKSSGNV